MISARENPHSDGPARTEVAIDSHRSLFRVFAPAESLHVATLLCPDPALVHELRQNGFRIPALDEDQDRR